jgi:hypothetical protein
MARFRIQRLCGLSAGQRSIAGRDDLRGSAGSPRLVWSKLDHDGQEAR